MPGAVVSQYSLKFSLRFAMFLIVLHTMAATTVFATAMPLAARWVLLLMIFTSLFYYLMRDVLRIFPDSWHQFSLDQHSVLVTTRDGSSLPGQVSSKTVVHPHFVVLCVKLEGRRLPVGRVIFPDAISTSAFREFCVHLKLS